MKKFKRKVFEFKGFVFGFVLAIVLGVGLVVAAQYEEEVQKKWRAVWHGTNWKDHGGVIDAQKIAENFEWLKKEIETIKRPQYCTSEPLLDPTGVLPDVIDCNGILAFLESYYRHGTPSSDEGCYYHSGTYGGVVGWFCVSRSQQKIIHGNWLTNNKYNCPIGKTLSKLKADGQITNYKTTCTTDSSTINIVDIGQLKENTENNLGSDWNWIILEGTVVSGDAAAAGGHITKMPDGSIKVAITSATGGRKVFTASNTYQCIWENDRWYSFCVKQVNDSVFVKLGGATRLVYVKIK